MSYNHQNVDFLSLVTWTLFFIVNNGSTKKEPFYEQAFSPIAMMCEQLFKITIMNFLVYSAYFLVKIKMNR